MKIKEAWNAYNVQLDTLRSQRQTLSKMLEDSASGVAGQNYDRVELTRELASLDEQIEATFNGREKIIATWGAVANSEVAKQQSSAMADAAKNTAKIMEVFRRISSGAKVPPGDEQKLMEYDFKLYMAAKQSALMAQRNDEEYDSLWDEEEKDKGEQIDPIEIADNTEIAVASPESVSVEATTIETADI